MGGHLAPNRIFTTIILEIYLSSIITDKVDEWIVDGGVNFDRSNLVRGKAILDLIGVDICVIHRSSLNFDSRDLINNWYTSSWTIHKTSYLQ